MARYFAKQTDYSITYKDDDGDFYIAYFDTRDEMFREAAKFFAFDDLDTGMEIVEIWDDGTFCAYAGWKPGMVIEFVDARCWEDRVWIGEFPEWDH